MKIIRLKRPKLNQIDLAKAILDITVPGFHITMSIGQWDNFLEEAYFHQDATLLEVSDDGMTFVAAYKLSSIDKSSPTTNQKGSTNAA